MQVTISEAAQLLGLSEKTIRRRVLSGRLQGTQTPSPNGYTWLIDIPDKVIEPEELSGELIAIRERVAAQDREIETKNKQIEQLHKQIEQLHILLQQAQTALSPPPGRQRSWWRFWER